MGRWIAGLGLLLACLVVAPRVAQADIRVWEQNGEEGDDPKSYRWLDLTAFLQPGWIFRLTDPLCTPAGADCSEGGDGTRQDFSGVTDSHPWLQRARAGFRAQIAWWLQARLEVEFSPTPSLQDAFLEMMPHPAAQIRLGQFQIPFLRAYQFNELNLAFIDRPLYTPISPDRPVIRYLSPRDVGIMFHGAIGDLTEGASSPVFEYQAGAFLGRGANVNRNDNDAFLYAIRTQLHILGLPEGAAAESDIAYNERPRIGVAAGVYANCDDRANYNRGFTADAEVRFRGLYASAAFIFFRNSESMRLGDFLGYDDFCTGSVGPDGVTELDFISRGAHAQVGYILPKVLFPIPRQKLELLARLDWVDPQTPYDRDRFLRGDQSSSAYVAPPRLLDSDNAPTQWRMTFGLNWFPTGEQQLRLSINYQHNREAEDIVTSEGRVVGVKNDRLWLQITAGL